MTFDLEKARAAIKSLLAEGWDNDAATVRGLVAEIERLRNDLQDCGSYVGIGPGEGDLPIPERVRRCVNRLKETQNHYSQKLIAKDAEIERLRGDNAGLLKAVIDIQEERDLAQAEFRAYHTAWEEGAARIKELEDALVEERAEIVCYDQDSTDEWWNDLSENGSLGKGKNEIRQEARDQLRAEGKIGPDTSKPRSWKITEERKAALETAEFAVSHLAGCYPDCERILGKPDQRVAKVLRAMLEEAGQ